MDENITSLIASLQEDIGKLTSCITAADEFVAVDELRIKLHEFELQLFEAQKVFERRIDNARKCGVS